MLTARSEWLECLIFFSAVLALLIAGANSLSFGADGVQYVSIAKHYADSNWSEALNAYWSPLISWLIWPMLELGLDPFWAFKIWRAVFALISFAALQRLAKRFELSGWSRYLVLGSLGIFPLHWMMHETPDGIFAAILLILFLMHWPGGNNWQPPKWYWTGILLAVLYFSKSFGLPYFLILFPSWIAANLYYHRSIWVGRIWFRYALKSMGLALLLSGVWMILLSQSYGSLTYANSGKYNARILGSDISPTEIIADQFILPTFQGNLQEIPSGRLCAWEEPYLSELYNSAEASAKLENLGLNNWPHYRRNFTRNIKALAYNDGIFAIAVLLILLLSLQRSQINKWPFEQKFDALYCLIPVLIMIAGYSLILIQDRYLWAAEWFLAILFWMSWKNIKKENFRLGFGIIALLTLAWTPVLQIADSLNQANLATEEFTVSRNQQLNSLEGPWASIDAPKPGNYRKLALMALYADKQYLGISSNFTQEPLQSEVKHLFVQANQQIPAGWRTKEELPSWKICVRD